MTDIVYVQEIWDEDFKVNSLLKEGWKLLNVVNVHNPEKSDGHFLVYILGATQELYDRLDLGKSFNVDDMFTDDVS